MEITNRINSLIDIASNLIVLLEKENAALRERRPQEVISLLEEKNTLTRAYESRVDGLNELLDNSETNEQPDGELREKLKDLGQKLNSLTEENAMLLKAAIDANKRVVEIVAEAVKASQPGPGTYAANGAVDNNKTSSAPRNVAFSLDRSL